MIYSFSFMLLSNNDTHFFPFLYVKISKQDCLISFNSFIFHSFALLKYILFLYELPNERKGKIPKNELNDYFYEMS